MTESGSQTDQDSLGLYVHIPFCTSKCAYCAFYSEPVHRHDTHRLMQAIHTELAQHDTRSVCTAYIGGGSPSSLPTSELTDLVKAIMSRCPDLAEFTVECNPGQVTLARLKQWHDLGVNRLSMGAQSFDAGELRCLGRSHDADTIKTAVHLARQAGFNNLSLDLIFAICGSTPATWQASLNQAIALHPEHISAYALTLEPGTPLAEAVAQGRQLAVDESTDMAMYEQAIAALTQAGYEQYEISNFARPGYTCRHNLGTWLNHPYLGIGPSAASSSGTTRTQNFSDIKTYVAAMESGVSPVETSVATRPMDRICETAVLNLRTRHGIDVQRFRQVTGQDPHVLFAGPIRRYCEQGLLTIEENRIFLTARALPIADSVLCDFAAL
ncbi:MAG: radical SAM family heme chaperone HemW [Phycisphaerae bacterium]|nr:radical SAM family heme chaperone HemW [Phycisphaerae bacterium]